MSVESFIDTNVFVYSFDPGDSRKRESARAIIARGLDGASCISWQVLQEFSNVALRKFEVPMRPWELREYMDVVLMPLCRVWPDAALYHDALEAHRDSGFSWYDSLILASALRAGARTLLSEDMSHGFRYKGLRIENPFR
jgi:predicted nucleic acid-binding protein